ncbi:hypothetical protein MKX01_033625, partial [Papaver californicum]
MVAKKRCVGDLTEADLRGKKVLVRVDFDVPLDHKLNITDDTKIKVALPTIQYLISHGPKVILATYIGNPEGVITPHCSLKPVVATLTELMQITFDLVAAIPDGGVLLLENLRFYKEEEKNDLDFAKKLASLADLYVNDVFRNAHIAHASTEGVTRFLSVAGFLMQKRPFVAIVCGSKPSSEIGVIESLLEKVDALIIGGRMVFTFHRAQNFSVGTSLLLFSSLSYDVGPIAVKKIKKKKNAKERSNRSSLFFFLPLLRYPHYPRKM